LILDLNASTSSSSSTQPSTPHQVNSTCNTSESQSSDEGDRTAAQKSTSSQTTAPPDMDEYNFLYLYNPKDLTSAISSDFKTMKDLDHQIPSTSKIPATPITPLVKLDAEWETMFARAEGLYGYGHTNEACVLCVKLVDQFLKNPPNFIIEIPPSMIKGKRKKVYIKINSNIFSLYQLIINFYIRLIRSVITCQHWHQKFYKSAIFCAQF